MATREVKTETKLFHADTHAELCELVVNQGIIPVDDAAAAAETVPAFARYVMIQTYLETPELDDVVGTILFMDESMQKHESFTV